MSYADYIEERKCKIVKEVKVIIESEGLNVKRKTSELAHQRFFLMHYLRSNTKLTLREIGRLFGKKHDMVLYGFRMHTNYTENKDLLYLDNTKLIREYLETLKIK